MDTTATSLTALSANITASFLTSSDDPSSNVASSEDAEDYYSLPQSIVIIIVAGILILVTVVGNIMVMVSFHIDKQLQTISNYFLLSLAVADFAIGLISMPLFTVYQVMGRWVLGPVICDTWLAIDYLASNASVLNLLIISFDRFFSVTRPLTYRARRTNQRAAGMIASAWLISLALWPPWIFAWPYIEGERTVQPDECYIQFIETNYYATFGTAIAAFYLPVAIMCALYYRIWRETEQRKRDLTQLQAVNRTPSKRSVSSDREEARSRSTMRRRRKKLDQGSSGEGDSINTKINHSTRLSVLLNTHEEPAPAGAGMWLSSCCSGSRERGGPDFDTPNTAETPLQNSVLSRWMSQNGAARLLREPADVSGARASRARPPLRQTKSEASCDPPTYICTYGRHTIPSPLPILRTLKRHHSSATLARQRRSVSSESVYTIVIKFPEPVSEPSADPSITMLSEPPSDSEEHQPHCPLSRSPEVKQRRSRQPDDSSEEECLPKAPPPPTSRRPSRLPQVPASNAPRASIAKPTALRAGQPKKKRKREEKKQDRKAAKTLSAILLAFIITWTPYNVLVLLRVVLRCDDCIPKELWNFSYYLCYINSTVNPLLYALCNASFRRTYVKILTCTWEKINRNAGNRPLFS